MGIADEETGAGEMKLNRPTKEDFYMRKKECTCALFLWEHLR